MTPAKLYIWMVSIAFVALAAVMLLMPRSRYSELEKRDLAEFPQFTQAKLADGSYAADISGWFSDTEPYRDQFMAASMKVRDAIRYSFAGEEEAISFHKTDSPVPGADADAGEKPYKGEDLEEYENHITAEENAKIKSSGIIIVGSGPKVRALNAFGGAATGGSDFAKVVSDYQKALPGTKVYAMVVPLSSEFYTPDKAKSITRPQRPFIKNIYSKLENGAMGVNAYNALADHVEEDIYLRTDHHWAPLGAFYAAEEFAKTAGVPFKPLSSYTKKVIHGYVGSMYGYSNDISLKNAPEDFVYYTPNGLDYKTTYWIYNINKNYQVTGERKPYDGQYFAKFPDGSSAAYSTFMGGDQKLTRVKTGVGNGRRLIVIKDSYGNALPGYLFYSFDEIHIIDFRYFTRNMKRYARENGITDLLFCVNVFNAYSSGAASKMARFLTQGENSFSTSSSPSAGLNPNGKNNEVKEQKNRMKENDVDNKEIKKNNAKEDKKDKKELKQGDSGQSMVEEKPVVAPSIKSDPVKEIPQVQTPETTAE
ncbi:MAG: hypothetical protein K2J70_07330 [Muribaculaceae bacterium]|nr:hypothetical protein [Muribaculaceae bacterium]